MNVPSLGFDAKVLRKCSMKFMTGDIMNGSFAKLRSILVRSLAIVAVVLTYAVSSIGTIGIAGLVLTPAATQAQAGWRGRGWRRGYYRAYPRRYYYRRRWW